MFTSLRYRKALLTLRRTALCVLVIISATLGLTSLLRATTSAAVTAYPLYSFINSGVGALPWNGQTSPQLTNNTLMTGAPHSITNSTEGVVAYLTSKKDIALYTLPATGTAAWTNYSAGYNVPTPAADPVPFFDPNGNVDMLYVDQSGNLDLITGNDPVSAGWSHLNANQLWQPHVVTNLSDLTGQLAQGVPSVILSGNVLTISFRTASSTLEVLSMNFVTDQPIPVIAMIATPLSVPTATPSSTTTTSSSTTTSSTSSTTSTSTTTTTAPPTTPGTVASDPILLPTNPPSLAVTTSNNHALVFIAINAALGTWHSVDVTLATRISARGSLAATTLNNNLVLVGLSTSQCIQLFQTPLSSFSAGPTFTAPTWSVQNVEGATTLAAASNPSAALNGVPLMAGLLSVNTVGTSLFISGQASDWGDLFSFTGAQNATQWSATDVSATGGQNAKSVGPAVAGLTVSGQLSLYAAGVSVPIPQGTGVYAIPDSNLSQAITDGWPVISDTGGLGALLSPWVDILPYSTCNASHVVNCEDFITGRAIAQSHRNVAWISFWTVSGPIAGSTPADPMSNANYYHHGYMAGRAVATQIDLYRAQGMGIKPNWVVFDPEGWPDSHSGLDSPSPSAASIAKYSAYWQNMLRGWAEGLASVDATLSPGVYANQGEYIRYQLASLAMPVFPAIAFGNGSQIVARGTLTAGVTVGATSIQVSTSQGFDANQYLGFIDGTHTETVQIASSYNGTSLTIPLTSAVQFTHPSASMVATVIPPHRLTGMTGSNIRGWIAFNATCGTAAWQRWALKVETQILNGPVWNGQFNTLQFDPGLYCAPAH